MNRRDFLTATSVTAAGGLLPLPLASAAAPTLAPSTTYVPGPKAPTQVVPRGEFVFAATHLDHGHITEQCVRLAEAGAVLKWVYDPDVRKRDALLARFPGAKAARALDEILADAEVKLVTAAAITSERGPLGCRVMEAGKDYLTDKAPFTSLEQLEQARAVATRTGRKYLVVYGARVGSEAAMFATDLVRNGAIGRVVQVAGFGPHRLSPATRPAWFFERAKYGGILVDLGSHQCEEFLTYAGATDATVTHAAVGNFANPATPELEDFGEASCVATNGATNHFRVDWMTPGGLGTWGDGRTFILGTKGYIEMRKYIDVARGKGGEHLFLVDDRSEHYIPVAGKMGLRFSGDVVLDCLQRTERAMTQAHTFKAAELCLRAQAAARWLT